MSYGLNSTTFPEEIYAEKSASLVVLNKPWINVTDSEKVVLEKILGLAQLSLNHVKIITADKLDILQWTEKPRVVLAFGIDAPGLSKNENLDVQGVKLVVTLDLLSLESADKETKQKLASAIKNLI
jgi:hypothetical protein